MFSAARANELLKGIFGDKPAAPPVPVVVVFTHDEALLDDLVADFNARRSFIGADRTEDLKDIMKTYAMRTLRRMEV